MLSWQHMMPSVPGLRNAGRACMSLLCAGAAALGVASCGTVGEVGTVELTSLGGTTRTLRPVLGTGTYAQEAAQSSFILSDVDFAQLESGAPVYGYVLHVNLLWVPKAGRTAVDPTATNTSIRLVVIAGNELGVYGGGGFAWPDGDLGEPEFTLELVGSNMSLIACTPGFQDLMSPASLTGTLRATLDDAATRRMRRSASQYVTNATRSVRWVKAPEGDASLDALLLSLADAPAAAP
jgi:hypothetical protein